jgi:hypothetical protein
MALATAERDNRLMLTMPRATSSAFPAATGVRDDMFTRMAAAFAAGLFVGAALGVLLAPMPGRASREWLVTHGREARRRVTPLFHPHEVSATIRTRGVRGLWDLLQKRSGQQEDHRESPRARSREDGMPA